MKVLGKVKILTQNLQELLASLMDDCRALIARAAKFFGTSKPKSSCLFIYNQAFTMALVLQTLHAPIKGEILH